MEDIYYTKNPIKEVICRVDFLNEKEEINSKIPDKILGQIKELYPLAEPIDNFSNEFQMTPVGIEKRSQTQFREWFFYSRNRKKRLSISKGFMYLHFFEYDTFENFSEEFLRIIESVGEEYDDLDFKRFGLRYVNNIEIIGNEKPLEWNKYINDKLLSIFEIPEDPKTINKAMQHLEMNYGDSNLRFQYGMSNPDFPATIKKKIFILDFDAYTKGLLNIDDIKKYLPEFHKRIQKRFEESIKDAYRKMIK